MSKNEAKTHLKRIPVLLLLMMMLSVLCVFFFNNTQVQAEESASYSWNSSEKTLRVLKDSGIWNWQIDYPYEWHTVTQITFEEGVTSIGDGLFRQYSNYNYLHTIVFNCNIHICNHNFINLTALSTVIFNQDCRLSGQVFCDCSSLRNVEFHGNAFLGFSDPITRDTDKTCIAFYNTPIETITFEGKACIAGVSFNNCNNLRSITFKDESCMTQYPFSFCPVLSNIDFQKPTYIYDGTPFSIFWYREAMKTWEGNSQGNIYLESLYFPDGSVISNCPGLFSFYYRIKSVEFEGDIELDVGSFNNCYSIEKVIFNKKSSLSNGCFSIDQNSTETMLPASSSKLNTLYFGDSTTLLHGCFDWTFNYAFTMENNKLESLHFPKNSDISQFGGAFKKYTNLKELIFEDDDLFLRDGSFAECTSLETVIFPGNVVVSNGCFNYNNAIKKIEFGGDAQLMDGCFQLSGSNSTNWQDEANMNPDYCNFSLKELVFSGTLQIGYGIFSSCAGLEKLEFFGDVTIKAGSFLYLTSLKELKFHGKSEIREGLFSGMLKLETLEFDGPTNIQGASFIPQRPNGNNISNPYYNNTLKTLRFPEGSQIGSIYNGCFCNFRGLESIIFEGDVKFNQDIFGAVPNLRYLEFKGEATFSTSNFTNCEKLETLIFGGPIHINPGTDSVFTVNPQNTHDVDTRGEFKNTALKKVVIPEGSDIGVYSSGSSYTGARDFLKDFVALEEVVFEGDIELFGGAFSWCDNLQKITFNKKSKLYEGAFAHCKKISEINFGDTTELYDGAFYACDRDHADVHSTEINNSLKEITFPEGSILGGTSDNLEAGNFGGFFQCYNALEKVTFEGATTIGGGCFQHCNSLKEINFNKPGTTLIEGAFSYNEGLTDLTFDKQINIIGGNFRFCPALNSVEFNADCTIAGESFTNNELYPLTALESVVFNGNCTVGENAFKNCTSLKSIQCDKKTTIQDNAFSCDEIYENASPCVAEFSDGSQVMSNLCFKNYTGLKEITFNDTAQTWVSNGFINCPNLNDIYYTAIGPVGFENLTFTNLSVETLKIHVPCISLERYKDELRKDTGENMLKAMTEEIENHNIKYVDNVVPVHQPGDEFSYDKETHWLNCKICHEAVEKNPHNISMDWKTDEDYHWHQCVDCGYVADKDIHQFDNYICKICFYEKQHGIFPITDDTINSLQLSNLIFDTAEENNTQTADILAWSILLSGITVVVLNAIIIIRKIRKSKKQK